jgi:hypothetical protein
VAASLVCVMVGIAEIIVVDVLNEELVVLMVIMVLQA